MERFITPIKQSFYNRFFERKETKGTKPKVEITSIKNPRQLLIAFGGLLFIVGFLILAVFLSDSRDRFLPNTTINEVSLGGLNPQESLLKMRGIDRTIPLYTIELAVGEISIASSSAELDAHYELEKTIGDILAEQQADPLSWLKQLLFNQATIRNYDLPLFYNQDKLTDMVMFLSHEFNQDPHPPQANLELSGSAESIVIDPGEDIFSIQQEETMLGLSSVLSRADAKNITVGAITETVSKKLTDEQLTRALARAENLVGEKIVFEKDYTSRFLNDIELISLLSLPDGYREDEIDLIIETWSDELNRPPQDAVFEYDPETLVVEKFSPDRSGWALDVATIKQDILAGLWELENTDTKNLTDGVLEKRLRLIETQPSVTLADTNQLGITERIGFGESYYDHSIPNRIWNVSLTANKISLTIIAPGEEFSFNQTLGDVSPATGFRPAYVIKGGRTLLGDGGGVCQVSTTLFRSLLDSGLQITRRVQHSYRVSYYELDEQPGFDATVYSGNVDLRFNNDTDDHVLVYMETDSDALYMTVELYGTSDGRTTEIDQYRSWDFRGPLPPEYAPDPSLAPGQLKQIDWAASGIKAEFTHTVRDKDGKIMNQKTYYSNYRPWAAKYLQGV